MMKQLSPPQNWDEFEQLCHGLWTNLLSDPYAKIHGRRGQSQHGIDVYGYDHNSGTSSLVGIQCKGKDNYLERNLSEQELRNEVKKAVSFQPKIEHFILATTGKRDVNIQSFTRTVNSENINAGSFSVSTWSWADISEEIQNYPVLLRKHYPENFIQPNLTRTIESINLALPLSNDHEQKIAALFEIDDIKCELQSDFRNEVRDFVLELASNSFRHGQAKKLEIQIFSNRIIIKDNGMNFNPLATTHNNESDKSMQGLKYIKYFIDQYEEELTSDYTYDEERSRNIVTLDFFIPIIRIEADRCTISFSDYDFISRGEATTAGAAQQFPEECEVYIMHIDRRLFMMSSLYIYLMNVVSRLPEDKKLKIILPVKSHKEIVDSWFDPSKVEVIVN